MSATLENSPPKLRATTLSAAMLDARTRGRLFDLYAAHYEAVNEGVFLEDLAEKHWVVLMYDSGGTVQGFSTLKVFSSRCPAGWPIRVLFSGDTVIDRHHWGTQALAFEWIRFAGRLKAGDLATPLYWFLVSKGPRTYRYLPTFSRDYWPRFDASTPAPIKRMIDHLAQERFGRCYDPNTGVVRFPQSRGQLAPELAEVPPEDLLKPEVAFFLRSNPGYYKGDELVCLTELSPDNLKPLAKRVLLKGVRAAAAYDSERVYGEHPLGRVA